MVPLESPKPQPHHRQFAVQPAALCEALSVGVAQMTLPTEDRHLSFGIGGVMLDMLCYRCVFSRSRADI